MGGYQRIEHRVAVAAMGAASEHCRPLLMRCMLGLYTSSNAKLGGENDYRMKREC